MRRTRSLLILVSLLSLTSALSCFPGYFPYLGECVDMNECEDSIHSYVTPDCGANSMCLNTEGSFLCHCNDGFRTSSYTYAFDPESPKTCSDIDECAENPNICGPNSTCINSIGNYSCTRGIHDKFELQLVACLGLSLSLVCLFVCVLTFGLIRSIQSERTKIHLHLSISLFLAFFIFLIGISRTENKDGCAVVAGLLHFFFLASFCWTCLESAQLFRITAERDSSFGTVFLMAAGYGLPALTVSVSALANARGYGTERYCWLRLDSIWTFYGPAYTSTFVNMIFLFITVWKLGQKFSSPNPDLDKLHKITTFTVTAAVQMCELSVMWIFGFFLFQKRATVLTYPFTIFATLQGVLLFVVHCLCRKQIRDEYRNILCGCGLQRTESEDGYMHFSKEQDEPDAGETEEA